MAVVVFATLGTWGDLFPFVGLAAELRRRGHRVRVAASPAWEMTVPADIEFAAVGRRVGFDEFAAHPEIFRRMPFGLRAAMRRFVFDQADELTADLREALGDADLLVAHPAHVVALNLAEQSGVPRAVASVFPGMIPSAYTVPGGSLIGPWRGPAGRAANRLAWRIGMFGAAAAFDRPINAHRRSLGLHPVRAAMLRLPLAADALIVMASPHVICPPPDWPNQVKVTSFIPWDEAGNAGVSARTEDFLAAGEPPILVTLGASSGMDPGDFFEQAVAAVLDAGRRVLLATGPATQGIAPRGDDRVHAVPFVPFSQVAPRCEAAIHHGGIGTTVSMLRAGLPQVVVPKGFDQPDTAARVKRLGIGVAVPWARCHRRLQRAIRSVLNDDQMRLNAAALGDRVRQEDGTALTVDVVEQLLQ